MSSVTTIMIQGTTSDAGKTTLVAGLCRVFKRRGFSVAPFKPQNMALNSAVTKDGGEIGRAQALQAIACGVEPHVDMNPVLIKPSSDTGAQIIIHGQVKQDMDAQGFHSYKPIAHQAVIESYDRLRQQYQTIVVEGAGSPAEINLREGDIANMGFAEAVDCPVVLVADIDRGGVFAHIVGTLALLSESEQKRVVGFVINRFRGDIALLKPGLDWLETRTKKPVLGVLPYIQKFYLDAEDAIDTNQVGSEESYKIKIVIPVFPRISNHTDFDALRLHPDVDLTYVDLKQEPPPCDLMILPGSKNVRQDLKSLKDSGWKNILSKHLRYGGKVIGICGGYQMLGHWIDDPFGVEGNTGRTQGLDYLPIKTTLQPDKELRNVKGVLRLNNTNVNFNGYEIHNGESNIVDFNLEQPIRIYDRLDGCISMDQQVLGTYIHGLFDQGEACRALLKWAGCSSEKIIDINQNREEQIDRLADIVELNLDFRKIEEVVSWDS